jgi:hypothetical protein
METLGQLHARDLLWQPESIDQLWISSDKRAVLLCDPTRQSAEADGWFGSERPHAGYRAPELLRGRPSADAVSDLYAAGALLYELRYGALPYPIPAAPPAQRHTLPEPFANPPEPLRQAVTAGAAGDPLDRILAHLIAPRREARFATAEAALQACRAALKAVPEATPTTSPETNPAATAAATGAATSPTAASSGASSAPRTSAPPTAGPTTAAAAEPAARPAQGKSGGQTPPAGLTTPEPAAGSPPAELSGVAPQLTVGEAHAADGSAVQSRPGTLGTSQPGSRKSTRKKPTRKRPGRRAAPWVLGGLGFLVVALLVLVLAGPDRDSGSQQAERARRLDPSQIRRTPQPTPNASPAADTASDGIELVEDDRLLWAAPDRQGAAPLTLLPPGPAMLVAWRPESLLEEETGGKVLAALSPELQEGLDALQRRLGLPWDRVARVTLALRDGDQGIPRCTLAVDLRQPTPAEELSELWQAERAQTAEGTVVYMPDDPDAEVYLVETNEAEQVVRFAVVDVETVQEIAEMEGGPIPLPRQLNELWRDLGGGADLAILGTPNFLFADGRAMLRDYASESVSTLKQFLIPDVAGYAVRMDFDEAWFTEVKLAPGGGTSPATLKEALDGRIAGLPQLAESFLIRSTPHPSWKPLAIRLPAMMRAVEESLRSGIVDGKVIANSYLPGRAAPNVLLGGWLALNTPAGTAPTPPTSAQPAAAALTSMDQLLAHPLSISFGQESLEMAGEAIREQFNADLPPGSMPLEIVLLGGDLQLDGITQNQQIRDFNHRDTPLSEVLDDLVQRANPDRTVTALNQPNQALVWVVGTDPERADREAILITTRSQAEKKNYTLPPQFRSE